MCLANVTVFLSPSHYSSWTLTGWRYQGSLSSLLFMPFSVALSMKNGFHWARSSIRVNMKRQFSFARASVLSVLPWSGVSSYQLCFTSLSVHCQSSAAALTQRYGKKGRSLSGNNPSKTSSLSDVIVAYMSSSWKHLNWDSSSFQWHFPWRADYTVFYLLGGCVGFSRRYEYHAVTSAALLWLFLLGRS